MLAADFSLAVTRDPNSTVSSIMYVPLAMQEMVLAVRLILKGSNSHEVTFRDPLKCLVSGTREGSLTVTRAGVRGLSQRRVSAPRARTAACLTGHIERMP
jgi:hypothetical protein